MCEQAVFGQVVCVCEQVLCEEVGGGGRRRRRQVGGQNQKQEPHTKMWGKTKGKLAGKHLNLPEAISEHCTVNSASFWHS